MRAKQIQLSANIATADMLRKRDQVQAFANKGLTTRVSLKLKGRERQFVVRADDVMASFLDGLDAMSSDPTWSGHILMATVMPTK